MSSELFCIGNAIVDVFSPADPAWLDGMGITEPVQHIPGDQVQGILEKLSGTAGTVLCSGGAAANVAKIAAMLKMNTTFAGCVGDDAQAALFRSDLDEAGVVSCLKTGSQKTGLCFVFNCGGGTQTGCETRIAASPGASLEFTEADVSEDLIAASGAVVLDGFMLDRQSFTQHILQLADNRGIPVALDAASVFQIREKTEAILHYSRNYPLIIFMNADECIVFFNTIKKGAGAAAAIIGVDALNEREKETLILREICPVLKYLTEGEIFPVIVIKLGGRGAVVLAGGNIYREETFTIIPRNTVGAGDAFCAAFVSAWIRGKSIRECAALGNKVAREILTVPGTRIKAGKLKSFAKLL
jgi:sugar/nucleoside kinase (ribokinase family)